MPYPVQRYARVLNRFCVATKAFTKEEIEKITEPETAIGIDAWGVWMDVKCN